jgi:hypothetical protein
MTNERFSDDALDHWRTKGDEPADVLARELLTTYGVDEHGAALDEVEVIGRAMRALMDGPASPDSSVHEWLAEGPDLPDWADDELIAAGQRFFARWPLPIATTLFCAALPKAYAAPHGAAVMTATSRLAERKHVARRLAETGRMVFDVMDPTTKVRVPPSSAGLDPLPLAPALRPGSQGYLTARTVRLLHGLVRQTLLTRPVGAQLLRSGGMPISQEELLGTLLTFTIVVLDGLDRLGIPYSHAEAAAYMHTWSVVGALLGIDEELLPLTVEQGRELGTSIVRRNLRPNDDGRELVEELLDEMRMAMPTGFRALPTALVHRLVPDVARMLDVPDGGPFWPRAVELACKLMQRSRRVPGLRELIAAGPGAAVGRAVLQMYMDRQKQAGVAAWRVEPGDLLGRLEGRGGWRRVARRTARRVRRRDEIGSPVHAVPGGSLAVVLPPSVALPIDAGEVRVIASEGFPLWERREKLVERNRHITVAYADLSRALARALAGSDGVRDANWCTFATWSSRTIGTFLEQVPGPGMVVPPAVGLRQRFTAEALTRRAMTRTDGAPFRVLAAGNRIVFLEIGLALATFIEMASAPIDDAVEREKRWQELWAVVEESLATFAGLDESWIPTARPDPNDLRRGLRHYFEALHCADPHERSQHVFAGNLLLGAYEQRRVDGYVSAALSLFSKSSMRRLICAGTGRMSGLRSLANQGFARLLTRRMDLYLPGDEVVPIDEPLRRPTEDDRWVELESDDGVTIPVVQALIDRFDLRAADGVYDGCRDWSCYADRMRTIGWLFRSRQRQQSLFGDPFPVDEPAE